MKGKTAKNKGSKPLPSPKTAKRVQERASNRKASPPPLAPVPASAPKQLEIRTDVDRLLELVERKGEVPVKELAMELKLAPSVVEEICEALQAHNLLEVKYSILRGGVAGRVKK